MQSLLGKYLLRSLRLVLQSGAEHYDIIPNTATPCADHGAPCVLQSMPNTANHSGSVGDKRPAAASHPRPESPGSAPKRARSEEPDAEEPFPAKAGPNQAGGWRR